MGWDRQSRGLSQSKLGKPNIKQNLPLPKDGDNGDMSIRNVTAGVFSFFKALGTWFKVFNNKNHMIPDKPNTYDIGSQHTPWRSLYLSENSLHIGNTKSEQGKISLSSDKTDLVFKNKAGTERKVVGKKANSTAGDIEHTITLGVDNTSGGEGILALGTGASNNGGIISSSTNWASTPSVHGLRVMNTTTTGATMRSVLQAKTSVSVAVAKAGVRLCTYNGPAGAITLDGSVDSTDPSGLANTGTLWANSSDLPYWKAGTGTAYEILTTAGSSSIAGHLIPAADGVYNLGSASYKWRDLHISSGTIFIGGIALKETSGKLKVADSEGVEQDDFTEGLYTEEINSTNARTFGGASNWTNASAPSSWHSYDESTGGVMTLTSDDDASNRQFCYVYDSEAGFSLKSGKTYRLSYDITISSYTKGTLSVGFAQTGSGFVLQDVNTYTAILSATTRTLDFVADDDIGMLIINAATSTVLTAIFDNFSIKEVVTLTTATALGYDALPKAGGTITGLTTIDINKSGSAANDGKGLYLDFDRAVTNSGTNVHNDIGIDLDVNSDSLGSSSVKGMDIDVVSGSSATSNDQVAIGIDLDVDGADTNIGLSINTAGTHIKLVANADTDDYATLAVADTGDLTIATVGDGITDSDITISADGAIALNSASGAITTNSTFDGVDIATRDGVLTSTTALALGALPKSGGTFSGNVDMGDNRFTNAQRVQFALGGYITQIVDNDDMSDVSATKIASSESVKAYVDSNIPLIKITTVTLSEHNMNNLHTTPITIVAAQGSNKVIVPTSGMIWVDRDASTDQANTACDLFVGYDGGTSSTTTMYYIRRFMVSEAGDRLWHLQSTGETGQSLTAGDNVPLTVAVDSAVTSGSIDSMKVSVSYYVFDNS